MDILEYKYWCELPGNIGFDYEAWINRLTIEDCYIKNYNIKVIRIYSDDHKDFSANDISADISFASQEIFSYKTEECNNYIKIDPNHIVSGWYIVVFFDTKEDFAKFKMTYL